MARYAALAGGAALGAGLMFLFDPSGGRRRRALLRDKVVHYRRRGSGWFVRAFGDLEHRLYGSAVELKSRAKGGEVPDDILVERVRARLGRFVRHAHEVQVFADQGCITLHGRVAPGEKLPLLAGARFVPGVHAVADALQVVAIPEGGLPHPGLFHRTWKPATKLVAGTAGSLGLAAYALNRMRA